MNLIAVLSTMESHLIHELIGYTASILIAVSLMMSAVVRLRVVNMIGAFLFAVYGILIGSIPVLAMNGLIVFINIYHLLKIYRGKEYFQLLEVDENSNYTRKFLQFHKDAIKTYQPSYIFGLPRNLSLFVLRDMVPAGLVQGTIDETGVLRIDLDFVIPRYRDVKVGRFLFRENQDYFRNKNIRCIRTSAGNKAHNRYLERAGFQRVADDEDYIYRLTLKREQTQ